MKKKIASNDRLGFTFIEVLVVTTIIAVLTAVGVTNFGVANKKARDGKRKGDLEQIRAALELYRTDEGSYPVAITFGGTLEVGGVTYMQEIPSDPDADYDYYYDSDGSTYDLCAALELDTTGSCTGEPSCGDGTCNYMIESPL